MGTALLADRRQVKGNGQGASYLHGQETTEGLPSDDVLLAIVISCGKQAIRDRAMGTKIENTE